MIDVILFYPKTDSVDIKGATLQPPYNLLYIATPLVLAGYNVKIIDQRIDARWKDTLVDAVRKGVICVGISAMVGHQIRNGLMASRIVREINKDIPIVWGGPHASSLPIQTSKSPFVDIVVVREGEETFKELVDALNDGKDDEYFKKIKGLCINGFMTPDRDFIDLNEFPDLCLDLVNIRDYFVNMFHNSKRGLHLLTSRGCPHACAFCFSAQYHKRKWRSMSAENVFKLIKNLIDRYKIDGFAFNDDSFLVDFKRVDKLCDLLLENKINIKWKASARVDAINRMSSEFIEKMKSCGLSYFFVGIESGSNRILSLMNKGITKDDAIRANRKLAKHGIGAVYSFITGVPTETRKEMFETLDLADLLRNENPLAGISGFLPYGPLYGTPLYDKAVKLGFKTPSSLEQWSFSTQEEIKRPYLSKKRDREIKYLFYLARLVDATTVIKYLQSRPVLCLLARLYMPIVRFRWRHRFLAFPLDIWLVELLYLKGILT